MDIDRIENKIAEHRRQATERRREIQASKEWTPEHKSRLLAELDKSATETHRQLKKDHAAAVAAERERLQRKVFAKPSAGALGDQNAADMSWRQALDVAERVKDPQGMAALIERTRKTGDTAQRRAALLVASERNYVGILSQEAAEDASLQELLAFERRHGTAGSVEERFARNVRLGGPPRSAA